MSKNTELTRKEAKELAKDRASEVLGNRITKESSYYLNVLKQELKQIKKRNKVIEK